MSNDIQASPVGIIKKDIYIITNDINNKVYIGQSKDVAERFKSHCKNKDGNSLIDDAIQQYGKRHFTYSILEHNVSNYDEREKYWIRQYNCQAPNGYNIQEGGAEPPHHYGDNSLNTKLADSDLILLKEDLKNTDLSLNALSKKYNISKKQILRINQGLSRAKVGEKYPIRERPNTNGKLAEEDVDDIIEILQYTYRFDGDIAKEYGVAVHTISNINFGYSHHRNNIKYPIRTWKSSGTILFTYEEVTQIMDELLTTNISIRQIANKYNVSPNNIYLINNGTSKKYRRNGYKYPLRKF